MPSVANFYSGTLAYILSEIDSPFEGVRGDLRGKNGDGAAGEI
jgi:hypothetical protein